MADRVNAYLDLLVLDYDKDVAPLTPKGNATERHLCLAYARKAAAQYPEESVPACILGRKNWEWRPKIRKNYPRARAITDLIRAKTMKKGGVGCVQPDSGFLPQDGRHESVCPAQRCSAHHYPVGWHIGRGGCD